MKKLNRYNVTLAGLLLLIIYAITMNLMRLHWQEEQFLDHYKKKQQAQNDLLALKLENYIKRDDVKITDLDNLVEALENLDTADEVVWKYIYYNDMVLYYKNKNYFNNNGAISLSGFTELLNRNNIINTSSVVNMDTASFGIGLAIDEKAILMDSEVGKNRSLLILENTISYFVLALVAGGLLLKVMRKNNKCKQLGSEIIALNNKVEALHQELSKQNEVMQREKTTGRLPEDNHYDNDLVQIIFGKLKEKKYYPLTMIFIQFHMGNLYFSKSKMQKIERELRSDYGRNYELFEVGKGEYLILMIRTDILEGMQVQVKIEKNTREIACNHNVGVSVKSRSITNEEVDLEQELVDFRMEELSDR